jgi:hypothetical protein
VFGKVRFPLHGARFILELDANTRFKVHDGGGNPVVRIDAQYL